MAACLLTSLALTIVAWIVPEILGVGLLLPSGRHAVVWTDRARVIAAAGFLCWALTCLAAWRGARNGTGTADSLLAPLAFLPLSLVGFLLTPMVPQAAAANLSFFLPVLLAAVSLSRWLQRIDARAGTAAAPARGALLLGVGFWIFYALAGWYFTATMVKPPGDTGHYLVLAESLYRDHDLDLRNNLGPKAERDPLSMHISPFSREGRLYSWHSFGLPLLLAPLGSGGAPARHLVLGLFAGLCGAGLWELCRIFGALGHWSLTVILLFVLSRYWGTYSSLCLPEVAGAALTTWGVIAILRQRDHPWGSGWLCVACCAYLPWLHTRFIPVSMTIAGIYVVAGLLQRAPWRLALPRLGTVAAAYGLTLAVFAAVQLAMFSGGLPLPAGLFFGYPAGMWHAVAHRLGLLSALPLFAGMAAAAVWIVFRDRSNRPGAVIALLLTCVVLATASATEHWRGGASYPGRFLVVVTPLFVPALARVLGMVNPVARWWVIFLGLGSCVQFALVLGGLPEMGDVSLTYDHLNGLMEYAASGGNGALHPFAIMLLGGTGLLLFLEPGRWRLARAVTAVLTLVAAAAGDVAYGAQLLKFKEQFNARRLAELGPRLERARAMNSGDKSPLDLFLVSNRFHRNKMPAVIGQDGAPADSNDWAGRGYRWATLAPPFDAGSGWRACRLTGRLAEGAVAHWAIREGAQTLFEAPIAAAPDGDFAVTAKIPCRGTGLVSIVVRFEEHPGSLRNPVVAWTPFSLDLLNTCGFRL